MIIRTLFVRKPQIGQDVYVTNKGKVAPMRKTHSFVTYIKKLKPTKRQPIGYYIGNDTIQLYHIGVIVN